MVFSPNFIISIHGNWTWWKLLLRPRSPGAFKSRWCLYGSKGWPPGPCRVGRERLGSGFKDFVFSSRNLGKIPILTNIFQMGWWRNCGSLDISVDWQNLTLKMVGNVLKSVRAVRVSIIANTIGNNHCIIVIFTRFQFVECKSFCKSNSKLSRSTYINIGIYM